MTTAVLTPPTRAAAGGVPSSLDAELAALLAGAADECLVCGGQVELEAGRVECRACGSILQAGADQLAPV